MGRQRRRANRKAATNADSADAGAESRVANSDTTKSEARIAESASTKTETADAAIDGEGHRTVHVLELGDDSQAAAKSARGCRETAETACGRGKTETEAATPAASADQAEAAPAGHQSTPGGHAR